jgi:hypothetical protein
MAKRSGLGRLLPVCCPRRIPLGIAVDPLHHERDEGPVGAGVPSTVPLCDGEHEQRDAAAEECAGNDVGEPVGLEVRSTPGHADNAQDGERRPPSAARAGCGEEQDERQTARAGVGGMAGGEERAGGVDESVRAGVGDRSVP